jgi:RHS repeat-associated protein
VRAVFTYDYADRPSTLDVEGLGGTLAQSIASNASYLPSGPLDSLDLGNGLTETRAYDARYHPDRITVAGGSTLLDWDYLTDDVGNVQAIADVLDAANDRTYDYQDYQYFLTQGDGPWGDLGWTYDTIGNRLAEVRDGQPADVYDYLENLAGGNLPQLDTIQLGVGGTREYQYDEVGNQTQVASGANVVDFSYDDASRLARIQRASASASASLLYDGRSFLHSSAGSQPDTTGDGVFCDGFESGDTSAWSSGIGGCREARATRPIYSSEGMLHALDRAVNVGAGLADRYVFYFGSQPVASMELVGGSATFQYLSVDHLGTPILAMDGSGGTVWAGGFEPFGHDRQAGTPDGAQEKGVFLRFPGQWFDETWEDASLGAEVVYNVHRWHETAAGRYSRPDPAGVSRADRSGLVTSNHRYSYAAVSPLYFQDRLGLKVHFGESWLEDRFNQLKQCFKLFGTFIKHFEDDDKTWNVVTDPPGDKCIQHPRIRGIENGVWVPREGSERGDAETNCRNTLRCLVHEFYERWAIDVGGFPPSEMGTGPADRIANRMADRIPFDKCCSPCP